MFEYITENYARLRQEIADACRSCGREPSEVRLMAVTKTVEAPAINHAIGLGIDLIGENRVQELNEKLPLLNLDGVEVHLIGHLQTNKVRAVVPGVACIQSVDSLRLAREIDARAAKLGIVQRILAEVNIGLEESKFGFTLQGVAQAMDELALFPNIRVEGLMAVAPFTQSPKENLENFNALRKVFLDIGSKKADNIAMQTLSIGMSEDFREAIAAGSTLVRVGSALFGKRNTR